MNRNKPLGHVIEFEKADGEGQEMALAGSIEAI